MDTDNLDQIDSDPLASLQIEIINWTAPVEDDEFADYSRIVREMARRLVVSCRVQRPFLEICVHREEEVVIVKRATKRRSV